VVQKRLYLGEILTAVCKEKKRKLKIQILQNYDQPRLRKYFEYLYDEKIVFNLPKDIPYEESRLSYGVSFADFFHSMPKMYMFIDGQYPEKFNEGRRHLKFTQLLESFPPEEAKLLDLLRNKKTMKGITRKLIEEAFPGLLPVIKK